MFQRGFGLSISAALIVLFISIGIDLHAACALKPLFTGELSSRPEFVPIGPRRYPPGYRAAAFAPPDNPRSDRARHQTVIKN